MTDIVDTATRSRMMAGIKGKNTQPEMTIRRYLHGMGYRYRLHRKDLPGVPDLVLPVYKIVVFVHGCFWHSHLNCIYSVTPTTRTEFWQLKLARNVERDERQIAKLVSTGWRVLVIWECGLKHLSTRLDEILVLIESEERLMVWPETPPREKKLSDVSL